MTLRASIIKHKNRRILSHRASQIRLCMPVWIRLYPKPFSFKRPFLHESTRSMATKAAINFHYRHPGRTTASLQATVADVPRLIQTHQGPELSLGPVTFFTCFGSYYSGCLPHGGWNYTRASLWFAFNWRGSCRPAWKVVFFRHHDGLWKAVHPFEPGVVVTLEAHSMYRWVRHTPRSIALGTWIHTTKGSTPPPWHQWLPRSFGNGGSMHPLRRGTRRRSWLVLLQLP